MIVIGLILAGIILVSLEVFLPGGILGIVGGVLIFAGIGMVWQDSGLATASVYLIGTVVVLIVVLVIEFKLLPHTRMGKDFFLQSASVGRTLTKEVGQDLVGKTAKALTVLAPSGAVEVEGKRYEAVSEDGYIARGETLRVVSQSNFRLVVGKKNETSVS